MTIGKSAAKALLAETGRTFSIKRKNLKAQVPKVAVFSSKPYDQTFFEEANKDFGLELHFIPARLCIETVDLLRNYDVVCVFVNDDCSVKVLEECAADGCKLIALRCAGFNNVNLEAAERLDIGVCRVPTYSPYAVAEHTVALIMALNRHTHRAYLRSKAMNFSLNGLLGFDMRKRVVGAIGTGNIGQIFCRIMLGFECEVLGYDVREKEEVKKMGVKYVSLDELYAKCDIIALFTPLLSSTHHIINPSSIAKMKDGVMLINTSRGPLMDMPAVIDGLKSRKIGYLGMDVYDKEAGIFFEDWSNEIVEDDLLARLTTFPNVLVTAHQAFFTRDALTQIARTTLSNISKAFGDGLDENIVATVSGTTVSKSLAERGVKYNESSVLLAFDDEDPDAENTSGIGPPSL